MKRHLQWIVACALLSLSTAFILWCWLKPPDPRQAATVSTRWIGMTRPESPDCPAPVSVSGWTVRPLFPLDGKERGLQASVRKVGLDRFCVYEYHGHEIRPGLPQEILRRLLPGAEPDRVVMSSSAGSDRLEPIAWKPFFQRFSDQVQLPKAPLKAGAQPVRLAFLDSQPTGDGVAHAPATGKPYHGYALTNIAGELVRGWQGERPSVQIGSQLTLPLVEFDPVLGIELKRDETSGGFRGTYVDLAQAILDEIAGWQKSGRAQHLVLNLSVGWDGEKFGGWESRTEDMPQGVQAVYEALQVAADQGVLVIAAAGNELSGPNPTTRPLLPGGWESLGPKPLVYAVSGVDGQGYPLVNTRLKGEAPRVAYADHVVVPDFYLYPHQPTATLTGTSVSTAVVATTAALVWSYRPGLTSGEVMDLLAKSADALGRAPDFPPSTPGSVRRISLCKALQQACAAGGSCNGPIACDPLPLPTPLESMLSPFQPDQPMNGMTLLPTLAGSESSNLLDQPWVGPQPGVDPCPNCAVTGPPDRRMTVRLPASPGAAAIARASFKSFASSASLTPGPTYNLRIEIPSQWKGGDLLGATLEIFKLDSRGRKRLRDRYSLGTSLRSGETLEGEIQTDTPIQARLIFTLAPPKGSPRGTGPMSVDSPLFVEYRPSSR
jgi:hypothetical protein